MMDKRALLSVMVKNGDNAGTLAKHLGITQQAFSAKINEKSSVGFTQPEILSIKEKYDLNASDIDSIFFNIKVS